MEIMFTAGNSLRRRQLTLKGETSLWMFPIYGCASFLLPLFRILKNLPVAVRGSIYALCIFIGEYASGKLLSVKKLCPWDYTNSRWHIHGLIRLDYFFNWFAAGLFFEHLLLRGDKHLFHGHSVPNPKENTGN